MNWDKPLECSLGTVTCIERYVRNGDKLMKLNNWKQQGTVEYWVNSNGVPLWTELCAELTVRNVRSTEEKVAAYLRDNRCTRCEVDCAYIAKVLKERGWLS